MIHTIIIGISNFQNGLNHPVQLETILRAKLWKVVMKSKNVTFF